jgi:hypothetical protein
VVSTRARGKAVRPPVRDADRARTLRHSVRQPDYSRLTALLEQRPGRTVTLTFSEIEQSIGAPLLLDAYERRSWWMTAGAGPGRVLHAAGWRIDSVDVLGNLATFGRDHR